MTLRKLLAGTALALAIGQASVAHSAATQTAASPDFTITFQADGQVSGTLEGLRIVDDLEVRIAGIVELHDLAPALLQRHVIRDDRSKLKEVWLDRLEVEGDELIVRGGGRYKDRLPLPFKGSMDIYSQSGSVELRLRVMARNGVPVVDVTGVHVKLGGLLGDVMKVFRLDDSIARIARPLIEAEIARQIAANVPSEIGRLGAIRIDDLAFVSLGAGRYGLRMAAMASIDVAN